MRVVVFLFYLASLFSKEPTVIDLKEYVLDEKFQKETAFNGSPEHSAFMGKLGHLYKIPIAIETGTLHGETTGFLARCFSKVYSIEKHKESFAVATNNLANFSNIKLLLGNSAEELPKLLSQLDSKKIFFYLDAHWGDYWPLLDELKVIGKTHKNNCIIVIDDFKVPSRPDIGYDVYKNQACDFPYVKDALDSVFSQYDSFYIVPPNPGSRAKLLVLPKSWRFNPRSILQQNKKASLTHPKRR